MSRGSTRSRSSGLRRAILTPVPPDPRAALARAWDALPEALRTPRQFLGRQYAGCGALIGAMPRCDFACRGCYLGGDANRVPAAPLAEIRRQLRALRAWLGEGGNVQLTDGELTLRDPDELVEIARAAREAGLVPMLMTHGDRVLRDPGLLRRLVLEGGLSEMSVHVDTTQRGRRDRRFRDVRSERDLDPLRDAFADLVRRIRRETGRPLHVATTVTVSRENLDDVPGVIRWLVANADAFKMVSFQPIAQVGRTEADLGGGVDAAALWQRIERGLADALGSPRPLEHHKGHLGHPDCSHFVQGVVRVRATGERRFVPLFEPGDARELAAIEGLLERVGGLTFRLDSSTRAVARALGVVAASPRFLATGLLPALPRVLRRIAPDGRLRFLWGLARGRERLHYLNLVSHHFMSADEIRTPRGRERLASCAFRVPIGGELVSMCEANALGVRERYYETLRSPASRSAA